jgi:hypothetical protein
MKTKRFKLSQRLADHLIQAILIFASVFIAFWLSDYRIRKSEEKQVNAAIESVITEVSSNKGVLERIMPNLHNTIRTTEVFFENSLDTVQVFNEFYLTEGKLRFNELLTYDSYQFLNQNNIFIPIDKRLIINRIYRQQEYVDAALNELTQFYKQRELFDKNKLLENYALFYNKIREIEGQSAAMLREYEFALSELAK